MAAAVRPRSFLSTPSARRATRSLPFSIRSRKFLSTPSARRATAVHGPEDLVDTISIHALREEGDLPQTGDRLKPTINFYPRPPRGGRPGACLRVILHPDISIHALREEGDRAYGLIYNEWFRFLSTPSARRATGRIDYETHRRNIFLSTPSARRATLKNNPFVKESVFLSTPSARRATQQPERMGDRHQISIHALREEGDQKGSHRKEETGDFYPRPPRGGRHPGELYGA